MNTHGVLRILLPLSIAVILQPLARGQSPVESVASAGLAEPPPNAVVPSAPDPTYIRPGPKTKLKNYLLYTVGPYPIAGAALIAASNQAYNTPPEWGQGAVGYGKRFGSNFGIDAIGTTSGYALAEVFHQDIVYYRCACDGVFPRLRHALISTLTARQGDDGHRVFSIPLLIAPYAGTMTAVYGWYPDRFGAKDGFRMGNYYLVGSAAENIAMEFIHLGHRSKRSGIHLGRRDEKHTPESTSN